MKSVIFAAMAGLGLGVGVANAQGLPPSVVPPVYGSHAFANQPYKSGTVFSEIFGHAEAVDKPAERDATSAKTD
jgi:hypothetical protein